MTASMWSLIRSDVDRYRYMMALDGTAEPGRDGDTAGTGPVATVRAVVLCKGLQASVVYRLGHALYRWQPRNPPARIARIGGRLLHFGATRLIEMTTGISIAERASIGRGLYIGHFGGVIIGVVNLGENCNISHGVTLGRSGRVGSYGRPTLHDRVWVGPGAVVTGPVTVGHDAVIGANAVVTRDVPAGTAALGVPATLRPGKSSFDMITYRNAATDPARTAARGALTDDRSATAGRIPPQESRGSSALTDLRPQV
jgi:serine O-acetyltransferase